MRILRGCAYITHTHHHNHRSERWEAIYIYTYISEATEERNVGSRARPIPEGVKRAMGQGATGTQALAGPRSLHRLGPQASRPAEGVLPVRHA